MEKNKLGKHKIFKSSQETFNFLNKQMKDVTKKTEANNFTANKSLPNVSLYTHTHTNNSYN